MQIDCLMIRDGGNQRPRVTLLNRLRHVPLESTGRREHEGNALMPYWSQWHYYQLRWTERSQSLWLYFVCPPLRHWERQKVNECKTSLPFCFFLVCHIWRCESVRKQGIECSMEASLPSKLNTDWTMCECWTMTDGRLFMHQRLQLQRTVSGFFPGV